MLLRALNVLIALAALVATSAALHRILPTPFIESVTPKLRYFAAHQDEFDTLFIGTSRIAHHVDPLLFDRITAEKQSPTHSFNFGIDGMHPAESFYVVEQILKLKPRKLRHVFIELDDVLTDWFAEARGTQRLAYWHDGKRTKQTLQKLINPRGDARWFGKIARAILGRRELALHLSLWAKQSLNLGRVADLLVENNSSEDGPLGPNRDGYRPPGEAMRADHVLRYEQKLARETTHARPRFVDPYAERSYREYARDFRALGADFSFIVTPVVTQSPLRLRGTEPVMAFNDQHAFPQLYRPDVRVDESHLTRDGAEEFTRLLALRFAESTR